MKIIRNGIEIELSAEERQDAYYEQQHEFDCEDVKGDLEGRVAGGDDSAKYAQQFLDDPYKLNVIATDKRRNMDKYDMSWEDATQKAIDDALAKVMSCEG